MQTHRAFSILQKKQTGTGGDRVVKNHHIVQKKPGRIGGYQASERCKCWLYIDIFSDLNYKDLEAIDDQIQHRICHKGQIIYAQGEQTERLFLLRKGRVNIYRLTLSGKRLLMDTIEAGTFFGEMPILRTTLRNAYAEAAVDSELCVMSHADIERVICEWPDVGLRIIEVLGRRLMRYQARLEEVAYRSVPARIAALFLRMSAEQHDFNVALTHQELGDMVGATRETVTSILDEFQRVGMVELSRGHILLRDIQGLKACQKE